MGEVRDDFKPDGSSGVQGAGTCGQQTMLRYAARTAELLCKHEQFTQAQIKSRDNTSPVSVVPLSSPFSNWRFDF